MTFVTKELALELAIAEINASHTFIAEIPFIIITIDLLITFSIERAVKLSFG